MTGPVGIRWIPGSPTICAGARIDILPDVESYDRVGMLLETKLHAPASKRTTVPRPRLTRILDKALTARLALVSAPPGFGKSTLVTDWLLEGSRGWSAAWLSLEARSEERRVGKEGGWWWWRCDQ